ncbi:MAG: hypothetical protein OXP28_04470 [Gammaproteobacteria bacterium]|nr:hypothetical protein [Gammaproteobacteria bacterium]
MVETEQAAGGLAFLAPFIAFVSGFVGSMAASYAYEKAGGAEGIDKAVSDAWDGFEARQQACQKSRLSCGYGVP